MQVGGFTCPAEQRFAARVAKPATHYAEFGQVGWQRIGDQGGTLIADSGIVAQAEGVEGGAVVGFEGLQRVGKKPRVRCAQPSPAWRRWRLNVVVLTDSDSRRSAASMQISPPIDRSAFVNVISLLPVAVCPTMAEVWAEAARAATANGAKDTAQAADIPVFSMSRR